MPERCDVIILTALPVECKAVLHHIQDPKEIVHESGTIYYLGSFTGTHRIWRVAVAEIGMGGVAAALEAEKAINFFRAKIALFVGIAGGIKDVRSGDVVAATKIYAYESGKAGPQRFEPRPDLGHSSHALEQRARAEAKNDEWLTRLDGDRPDPTPQVHIGALAAGEKVLSSTQSDLAKLLRENYGDTLAIEMEGHGFLHGVRVNQMVYGLVIRGISDLIDDKALADAAGAQERTARHAAAFAFQVLAKFTLPAQGSLASVEQQNRERLIQRVLSFWITGVFEQSLHRAALIRLELQESPKAVENPWRLVIQESERESTALPAETRITEVYDEAHGELLLLGEPGAGKTTLLLELARDLLSRAEREQTHPIPVVFNLSSWTRKQPCLAVWLREELVTKYHVPEKVSSDWINGNQILPLLDGLDEVDATSRPACMQAINEYHQVHNLVPLVVCCRVSEYRSQVNRLILDRAVTIQSLTPEQIHVYFAGLGEQVRSLRVAFQHDPVLQELAVTPLMLTVLVLAYQGSSLEEIKGDVSLEVRQQQIFATYTQRMLRRRQAPSHYSSQQTIHWLSALAQQMKQEGQTIFYIERMQPTWLQKTWQRRWYYGLLAGPISGLLIGFYTLATLWPFALTVFVIALLVGLLFGWLSEPRAENRETGTLTCTWMRLRQRLATALEKRLMVGVVAGFVFGISCALYTYLVDYSQWSLGSRVAGALSFGLFGGIYMVFPFGLAVRLERRIEPIEALGWSWAEIRRNILRWAAIGIGTGVLQGMIGAFPFLIFRQSLGLALVLINGLWTAFYFVLVIMLVNGVTRGLSKRSLDARSLVSPNQGVWHSVRYGVLMAILSGVIIALFGGAIVFLAKFWVPLALGIPWVPTVTERSIVSMMSHLLGFYPTTGREFWIVCALFWGLNGGAILGLTVGLYCGGAAYVQHFVLRFLLCSARCVPWNYPRFLDYAAERIFLRKVGGGYIFIHRLLLEYFASLEEENESEKELLIE